MPINPVQDYPGGDLNLDFNNIDLNSDTSGGGAGGGEGTSCLLENNLVLMEGASTFTKISDIQVGDRVHGALSKVGKRVLEVKQKQVDLTLENINNIVYKIPKGSLSTSLDFPSSDILISGNHHVILQIQTSPWVPVLIPARSISSSEPFMKTGIVTYYHLKVEDDDGFFVSGLALESFT